MQFTKFAPLGFFILHSWASVNVLTVFLIVQLSSVWNTVTVEKGDRKPKNAQELEIFTWEQ